MKKKTLNLQEMIEMGEYNPKVLILYEEFRELSRYSQYQLIRKALKNREKQLRLHWAELANQLELSKKPYLKPAMDLVMKQLEQLEKDEERLLIEFSR